MIFCIGILVTYSMSHVSDLDTTFYWENLSFSTYNLLNLADDLEHAATAIVYVIIGQILAILSLPLMVGISLRNKK
jgi:hypothetical protein